MTEHSIQCERCENSTAKVLTFKREFLCCRCAEKWFHKDRDTRGPDVRWAFPKENTDAGI